MCVYGVDSVGEAGVCAAMVLIAAKTQHDSICPFYPMSTGSNGNATDYDNTADSR